MKNDEKNDDNKAELSRRDFFSKLSLGLGGIAAGFIGIPVLAALLSPLLKKSSQSWRDVGKPDDFKIGTTTLVKFENSNPEDWAGITARSAAWLRRKDKNEFIAFSVNCTHLGCPVRWMADAQLFMCPCHGGVYYKDGSRASGPPPKGLERYKVKVAKGKVQILTEPVPITTLNS